MWNTYTLSLISFGLLLLLSLYLGRNKLAAYLPSSITARFRHYIPLETFESAARSGFSTSTFDLSQNLEEGEERSGLDEAGLTEVRRIMDANRVGFDRARLIRQERIFRKNGIDPNTGLPLDKKAITSLG